MSVAAGMMEPASLRHLLPERPCVLAGEGGLGKEVRAVSKPKGRRAHVRKGKVGPEGERHTELDRSPCPGRRCPCGCPQQVDRLDCPLA